jgi:D-3-phosphoglycerate dehydrogenase
MTRQAAIIGDHFMLPEVFEAKIREVCGDGLAIRTRKDDWPDEPMEHGYAAPGMDGLKEYFGDAEGVVDFVGDAEILVTQLAPMSRGMLERLSNLKMIAVSRGGPVNIDMAAARERGVLVVNTPGRNAPRWPSSRSAPSSPKRAASASATRPCAQGSGAAICTAPT